MLPPSAASKSASANPREDAADGDRSGLPQARTSATAPGHKIFPYLLRNLTIERADQVWTSDITYIPTARGFLYRAAVMDWFAPRILAWRLSITLGVDFCINALEEALRPYGRPEIFKSDRVSQFTSDALTHVPTTNGIAISMDGKGLWRDNVFVERFWRTVKYEEGVPQGLRERRRGAFVDLTLRSSGARPIKPIMPRRPSVWQHNARSAGSASNLTRAASPTPEVDSKRETTRTGLLTERLQIQLVKLVRNSGSISHPGRSSTYRRGDSVQRTGATANIATRD
jgi:transposase InsO family protein